MLTSLSRALDLSEGMSQGHAYRTARIALRLARELRLSSGECASLYYAALLKDAGGSSNASRVSTLFGGDDLRVKREAKTTNWSSSLDAAKFALKHVAPQGSVGQKLRLMGGLVGPPSKVTDELTKARCSRGALVAQTLGLGEEAASAIQALDEHWDGKGAPLHLSRGHIPLLARILCLSQTLEVFATADGAHVGYDVVQARSGRWFDPKLVQAALSFESDSKFWADHSRHVLGETVPLEAPTSATSINAVTIDAVCEAFARIVDAKSPFTVGHSTRVTEGSLALGARFGLCPELMGDLRRAALLHDLGRLELPNSLLDKPARLDEAEYARVRKHPQTSFEILRLIPGFERVSRIAAAHHERLDGRGYWRGLGATQLDTEMRILAAADVFDALRSERPYRGSLPADEALAIMRRESGTGLDAECVEALSELHRDGKLRRAA